jgi:hypothetical protein
MTMNGTTLHEIANDLQTLLALREHAYRRVEMPSDDAGARRLCDEVLLHDPTQPCTMTELALARFLLLRLGPDGTRDSNEQRAIDVIAEYLRARDAVEDTTPWVMLMQRVNHPITAEFLAASREVSDANAIQPPHEAARAHAAKRAANAVAEMRQALAEYQAISGASAGPYRTPMSDWDGPTDHPVADAEGRATFMECAECAAKPGSPSLCAACLHNRGIADELNRLFAAAALVHELRLTIKSRIDHRDRNAIRDLGAVVDDMIRRGWSP